MTLTSIIVQNMPVFMVAMLIVKPIMFSLKVKQKSSVLASTVVGWVQAVVILI